MCNYNCYEPSLLTCNIIYCSYVANSATLVSTQYAKLIHGDSERTIQTFHKTVKPRHNNTVQTDLDVEVNVMPTAASHAMSLPNLSVLTKPYSHPHTIALALTTWWCAQNSLDTENILPFFHCSTPMKPIPKWTTTKCKQRVPALKINSSHVVIGKKHNATRWQPRRSQRTKRAPCQKERIYAPIHAGVKNHIGWFQTLI